MSSVLGKPRNALQIVQTSDVKRTPRRPVHPFTVQHVPFAIQPFLIAPVLPGETLKNLQFQSRIITDPIFNPIQGWWFEHYIFYVKLRDLNQRDTLEQMILNIEADTSSINDATARPEHYHFAGKNYVQMCLQRVVEEWFRDEGETYSGPGNAFMYGNLPLAQISGNSWLDSFIPDDEVPTNTLNTDGADVPADEFEQQYNTWMLLRQQQLTEMSFEDYLGTFGVRTSRIQKNKPELIRYTREWSYPSSTVNPADVVDSGDVVIMRAGQPTSVVSASIAERADKDRFFAEPGFIFGVTVARPKVYFANQRESATHLLDNTFAWLPAVMRENPETSLRRVAQATGPLGGEIVTDEYWVDLRDLYMYGDQFVYAPQTTSECVPNQVDLPLETTKSKYPDPVTLGNDNNIFFVNANGEHKMVRQDGVVNLHILGTQKDQT